MSLKERNQLQGEIAAYLAAKLGIPELEAVIMIAAPFAAKYPNVQSDT
jgi:hypothetical protein